jgi:8-oxo-dGTP diphosphatase
MPLYLVRHAKAGTRRDWFGDDRERPISKAGSIQAEALADLLAPLRPVRLVSSPFRRCVQTLEPLAARLGLPIETTAVLAEGGDFKAALALLASVDNRSVLCSHGDVIPEVIGALERRGMEIDGEPNWRKGSVWVLRARRDGDESFGRAEAWPPPG